MDDQIRKRAGRALLVALLPTHADIGAARVSADLSLVALNSAGLRLVDAATLCALLDECEKRGPGFAEDLDGGLPWAYCIVCGVSVDGDEHAPIPHTADCPVRVLRASLPREEG